MTERAAYLPVIVRPRNSSDRDLRCQLSRQDDEVVFLHCHREGPELTGEIAHCTGLCVGEGSGDDLVHALVVCCGSERGDFLETDDRDVVFQGAVLVLATPTGASQVDFRCLVHATLP